MTGIIANRKFPFSALRYSLLILVFAVIFLVSLLPQDWHRTMYNTLFTLIYLNAALTIEKHRKRFFTLALIAMAMDWLSSIFNLGLLNSATILFQIFFFQFIVFTFIFTIAKSKKVNERVILDSINGYLLLGISFALLVALVQSYDPNAFAFPAGAQADEGVSPFSNYLYFTLVTLTTLGYGDVLPVIPVARSLATLISISGQLYIAIIIALLVGKFAASRVTYDSPDR